MVKNVSLQVLKVGPSSYMVSLTMAELVARCAKHVLRQYMNSLPQVGSSQWPPAKIIHWFLLLNVQVHLSHSKIKTKWYRKVSSMNILVHHCSAHPSSTKRGTIKSMFRTAATDRLTVRKSFFH